MLGVLAVVAASVFTASDMLDIQSFASGQPIASSPDGEWVAYVLTDISDEWNVAERRPTGHVHVQRVGENALRLSVGETRSSFPVWSPDGRRLAFFLEDAGGGQLAIWDRRDAKVTVVPERFTGRAYLAPQWSDAGGRIIYALPVMEGPAVPAARVEVVRSADLRIPGDAFFGDARRASLGSVDVGGGNNQTLLQEPVRLRAFRTSGKEVLYRTPTEETFGLVGREVQETFAVPLGGDAPPRVVAHEDVEAPVFRLTPDPIRTDPEVETPVPGMYTIARPFMDLFVGSENVTAEIDDQVADPFVSADARSVFFRTIDNETYDEAIYQYRIDARTLTRLTGGKEFYGNLSVGGNRLIFTAENASHPEELFTIDLQKGERVALTKLNPQLDRFSFSTPELFYYHNADGEKMGALLYKPPGMEPGEKFPVVAYVYEKLTTGIHRFQASHQIFLSHGYGILMPNVKVRVGETATSFVKSVVPAVSAVRDLGFTNGKFCLWGGSFGAYATSYVITQTNVFDCAVSRATPPELFRNWASGRDRDSDNIERGQARMGGSPFEVKDRYLSQSAFFHLDKVETPVLILHGVMDKTVLVGEGEMMFYALRRLGKVAELVLYRDGDHSLFRHSRADAIDVHQRMLDWFFKYLRR